MVTWIAILILGLICAGVWKCYFDFIHKLQHIFDELNEIRECTCTTATYSTEIYDELFPLEKEGGEQ